MTYAWSVADLAKVTRLPPAGVMLMLECYFDDSGTHDNSKIVVWGGVVGTTEQFQALEEEWTALLKKPLPEKPPLRRFHLYDCRAGKREFAGYSEPESDHLQYLFRSAILRSGVAPVAYGVERSLWDSRVKGVLRELFPAESAVFGSCAKIAVETAISHQQNISIVFDQGRMILTNQLLAQSAITRFPNLEGRAAVTYLDVGQCPALQAADIVANYWYRHAGEWVKDRNTPPEPHFRDLLHRADQMNFAMFEETSIDYMVENITKRLRARGLDV